MVFEDESSEDTSSLSHIHSSSSTDGLNQVPYSLEDPEYKGLELDLMVFCEKHGKASERLVAFEGTDTGRRFLACAELQFRSELVAGMKEEIAKKDADHQKLQEKYDLLVNLTRAQATVIQNLKLKHRKEKEVLTEARIKMEFQNAELKKSEEKLTHEKLGLKL
ncbi:uncharacterized protein [Aegilops tauschii subsp. strangulata]|uniref:uncharacterized protein n=1 Tax=Aegilops tauschii subsp. strangulata TaxID=200361 RepID=UPI003CC87540